jgi:hypothetical protein
MTLKGKRNENVELHASPSQPHAEDTSANHAPNHDEIRRRAFEIYLERGGLPARELEDWLQAENEFETAALFMRAEKNTDRDTSNSSKRRSSSERNHSHLGRP